jgi:competence protein ComEC
MFVYSVLFYIIGILIDSIYINNFFIWLYISLLCLACFLLFKYKNNQYFYIIIVFNFFIIGLFISSLYKNLNTTKLLNKPLKMVYIYGEIYKIEESKFNTKYNIYVKDIILNSQVDSDTVIPSSIKISYNNYNEAKVGDIIKLRVLAFPPSQTLFPNGFNFAKNSFFNKIGANGYAIGGLEVIKANQNNWFINLKNKIISIQQFLKTYLINQIKENINPKVAPFVASIALGEYDFLPELDLENLRNSGLAHLISISGYHITILSGFIFFILRSIFALIPILSLKKDSKKIASLITILFLLLYIFIVGNHTPAIRASVMTISLFLAVLFNFNALSLNSLFLAVFIILLFNPFAIYSAGFLLSCIATLIIILFANSYIFKKLNKINFNHIVNNLLYKSFLFLISSIVLTFFIELALSPILGFYFGVIPAFGVLANMLASPIFSFLLMPSLLGFLILPNFLGKYFLYISDFSTKLILNIADYFANITFNNIKIALIYINFIPNYLLAIYLFALVILCIFLNKKINLFKNKLLNIATISSPLIIIFVSIGMYFYLPKEPDIIIDYDATLIAYKYGQESTEYTFSTSSNNFIKSIWLKNKSINFKNTFNNNVYLRCSNENCFSEKNNYKISFLQNILDYSDACAESDIIILQTKKPFVCKKAIVIDTDFLDLHGSTAIYLTTKINIISNK